MDILNAPVLGRGFRPFFLLGAVYSAVSILIWAAAYSGYIVVPVVFSDPVSWHAHEMIYGFALAIVAGF
ncbi:MAG: NnrS family protein, partial [Alphaproteobacteria bacterium]|nr:NnrS family protein [Alphaproteobacteria bacterium]